ncbi:MAG: hypothetical protein A3B08_02215 [Candidatus Taylorbacteria bacterium RIFCSPLOWO2_01_FULL_43_44]|uniref:Uncharacterized protein n=1 Tax=Candidatus Taylorbacteria bacterium RIFCSPHIGHO2_02_FULL_43_32b TaxID=1802306 RepID=A0A1G2MGG9_9BACT|nr:MAG: hypothetical protein A2743_01435 [Candidatus Taylorbacteria bacterium RIFCSPHIGHO2_01_FULL_43_47]OHA22977.1 MAG: hypothetical protein A3C72_02050 [Candidatus Taylorbacteria bacterium RIFCSPHIGHO2_02_FULL_43_32b]OHA29890.1 MAG: hypothetical protein A3B08_02215 [Candidatus Taylorbacteria bacterium RIFCSPLOWO2_01_FULL_43_44]
MTAKQTVDELFNKISAEVAYQKAEFARKALEKASKTSECEQRNIALRAAAIRNAIKKANATLEGLKQSSEATFLSYLNWVLDTKSEKTIRRRVTGYRKPQTEKEKKDAEFLERALGQSMRIVVEEEVTESYAVIAIAKNDVSHHSTCVALSGWSKEFLGDKNFNDVAVVIISYWRDPSVGNVDIVTCDYFPKNPALDTALRKLASPASFIRLLIEKFGTAEPIRLL